MHQGQELAAPPRMLPATSVTDVAAREWVVAALLFGLMLVDGIREGGFWHADALIAGVASIVFLAAAALTNPLDWRRFGVVAALILLAAWWALRAVTTGSLGDALPLGASCVAFTSSFAAVRPLGGVTRQMAGLGIACLGAVGSLVGFAGLIVRWFPMAMPAQGLWRLSTTLTYSDAAGLVLGMCLLVALGVDRHPWLVRVTVCLCSAGLLASQSRGAFLAFFCACALVPWRRYLRFLEPLIAGIALGVVAIVTSPGSGVVPWMAVAVVAAIAVSAMPVPDLRALAVKPAVRIAAPCVTFGALVVLALVLHHEIGLRAFAPSDQDRSVDWATAWHQWGTAPIFGVGPDHLLVFHAADGSVAYFVHNEYLQVAADSGAIGLTLLLAVIVALFRATRRFDVLSSCACATLVCLAVGGAFDYDWHLTFVGFLGGWCAGLAAGTLDGSDRLGSTSWARPAEASQYARLPVEPDVAPDETVIGSGTGQAS